MATNTLTKLVPYIRSYTYFTTTWVGDDQLGKRGNVVNVIPSADMGTLSRDIIGERGLKKYQKNDVIAFALMALLEVQNKKNQHIFNLWHVIKKEFLTPKIEYSALATGLQVCNNCSIFQDIINVNAKDIGAAKDPPHFMIAVLDKMVVGAVKSIPVFGALAVEGGGFLGNKIVQTLWSNVFAEPATMVVGQGIDGRAGIASAIAACVEKWREDKLKKDATSGAADSITKTGVIPVTALNRHEPDAIIEQLKDAQNIDESSLIKLKKMASETKSLLAKKDAKKTTSDYYKASAQVIGFFGTVFPMLVHSAMIGAFKPFTNSIRLRAGQLSTKSGRSIITAQMDDSDLVIALVCGYYLKQSYITSTDQLPEQYHFLFEGIDNSKHDYIKSEHVLRIDPSKADKLSKLDAYGQHKYAWDSVQDIKLSGFIQASTTTVERLFSKIRSNVQDTLNKAFASGINQDDMTKCAKLVITCAVIANHVDYTGTNDREIKIPDVHIRTLRDLGYVETYAKNFGLISKDKKQQLTANKKLRYPYESSGQILSMIRAEASHKELAMLYTFCLYVVTNVDFTMLVLGFRKWTEVHEELKNLIDKLNKVSDDDLSFINKMPFS